MPLPSRQERVLGGRYRLVEPIGRGGSSVVWRAHDQVLGRSVAVKVLGAGDECLRERLRLEATAAGRLRNPHVAHMYDYGEVTSDDGTTTPYLVMELVDGQPLTRRLTGGAALDWRDAVGIAAQVSAALAAAHADGLVHRDVKPDNVLLTAGGVKLIDFGISAAVGTDDTEADGRVLGTVAYIAPERLTGAPVGPAGDVYALGIMLYRMVAGTLPWQVTDRDELLHAHVNLDPDPLPPVGDAPPELAEICAECLRKDPSQRPTAADLASLLPVLAGHTGSIPVSQPAAEIASVAPVNRRRAWRTVAALATVAACAAALAIVWSGSGTPARSTASDPPAVPCVATFAVRQDWGSGFNATLTLVNTGPAVRGWNIAFDFPGGQHLTTRGSSVVPVDAGDQDRHTATLRQAGTTVIASNPTQTLAPQGSVTLSVTGRYAGSNPVPLDFRLNDRPCVAQVAGAAVRTPPPAGWGTPSGSGGQTGGGGAGGPPSGASGRGSPAPPGAPATGPRSGGPPWGPGGAFGHGHGRPWPSPGPPWLARHADFALRLAFLASHRFQVSPILAHRRPVCGR